MLKTYFYNSVIWLFTCSKTKLKWKFFFRNNICVFYKIYIICRKKMICMEKKFYIEFFFTEKFFLTKQNINENVKNIYLIWKIYFYTENNYVTNKILNIYSFCKNFFFIIKNIFVKFRCERSNLVLKVSEGPNLMYSLN